MKKEDWKGWGLAVEIITGVFGVIYTGLQIYHMICFPTVFYKSLTNILLVAVLYGVFFLLECCPQWIHRLPVKLFTNKVRSYCIWMVRTVKLIFVVSVMVASVFDILEVHMHSVFGILVIVAILAAVGYFECRILREIGRYK